MEFFILLAKCSIFFSQVDSLFCNLLLDEFLNCGLNIGGKCRHPDHLRLNK